MRNVRASIRSEVLAGALGVFAGGLSGLLFYFILDLFVCSRPWFQALCAVNGSGIYELSSSTSIVVLTGCPAIGATAGVSRAGRRLKAEGNVWLALLGAIVASIPFVVFWYNAANLLGPWVFYFSIIFFLASSAIGATVGYNLRSWLTARKSKEQ